MLRSPQLNRPSAPTGALVQSRPLECDSKVRLEIASFSIWQPFRECGGAYLKIHREFYREAVDTRASLSPFRDFLPLSLSLSLPLFLSLPLARATGELYYPRPLCTSPIPAPLSLAQKECSIMQECAREFNRRCSLRGSYS